MNIIQQFVNDLTRPKYYLILANFLLAFFLILLSNNGVLPMKMGDFVFFSLMYLIFALYRPGWSFLFFIGTIALENVNLAPQSLGLFVRPYQMIGALTIFSLLLRYFAKRLNFQLVKLKWFDYAVGIFALAGFLSSLFAISKGTAFKQSIIIFSFAALYWLVRNYIQTLDDLKRIIPFFLGSSLVVVFYGIWQNIMFIHGGSSFEIMPGRPNGTFTEPDWLGIYLVLLIAVIYSIIYFYSKSVISNSQLGINYQITNYHLPITSNVLKVILFSCLIPLYILLILTVSRSAWLGAGFITLVFFKAIFTNFSWKPSDWNGKELLKHFSFVLGVGILSLVFVYVFHLTNFQLFNRAQSTGSGLQKITVACLPKVEPSESSEGSTFGNLPEKIDDVSELEKYGCKHINLEDIEKEKEAGYIIKEIYRTDPNVNIRSQIYQKSFEEIKKHPIFGIGWGNISSILGKDERGAGLNSSNIFLEVWLGSGIVGLLAFLTIWVYIFIKSVILVLKEDAESKIIGIFIVLGLFALLVPNLFNAGVYLGILWVYFAVAQVKSSK